MLTPDICVIGAGSGGLSVAAGASQMGASVVLIEKGKMGGDCLNTGCVPSKALLAAGKRAHEFRTASQYGIKSVEPEVDFAAVNDHVKGVIAGIAPHDSVERFEELGCTVLQGAAKFTGPRELEVNGVTVRAKRFVLATGSRAAVPPIPGLSDTPHLTNESLFDLRDLPDHLVVIGAGPIGLEMAEAFNRLGAKVTVLEKFRALPAAEPELAEIVVKSLRDEGIDIREGVDITQVAPGDQQGVVLTVDGAPLVGSHLLVAAGRAPNVEGLGLEDAGVRFERGGVQVDAGLRTTNKRIFAVGDVKGGPMFTHVAGYDAGIIIRRLLFKMPAKASYANLPAVTYTDPELAQVGMTEEKARAAHGSKVRVTFWDFAENDRARAEHATTGRVKVITGKGGKILGAGIAGKAAGETIHLFQLAMTKGMKMGDLAGIISPYPTLSEVAKRAAGAYFTPALYSERTRKIVGLLQKLTR